MTQVGKATIVAVLVAGLGGGLALAQPMGPRGGYGYGPGPGPGRMGPGMMGGGPGMMGSGYGFGDPAAYLDRLKTELAITTAQDTAWGAYADAVKAAAAQMQGLHQTMWEAMGTADWQERRDMMNGMFKARQTVFDSVHDAATKLQPALTAEQQRKAEWSLPGLVGPGRGMRGPMHGPWR